MCNWLWYCCITLIINNKYSVFIENPFYSYAHFTPIQVLTLSHCRGKVSHRMKQIDEQGV